jgi:hypothetical protein
MTKQQILKMTGLSEKEFYKQFPTKESWEMYANGGEVKMYADGGKLPEGILRSRLESHMSPSEAQSYIDSYGRGGVVDVYQLMGMPTPKMYERGSKIHPTLTFSAENNTNPNFQPVYSSNPYYNKTYSVNNRNTLAGTFPIVNNRLNLTGSYSDANDGTYTAGAALNVGDLLSGAGGKGPSRRYDNPDIAHRGKNSFINTYGHARAGITNKGDKIFPYWGFDVTAAHQMGRVKGPNGLRQPKGTIYASGEFNNVEDPLNAIYENDNYMRANLGGSYNFGKGLGVYGEAGYDLMRKAPRAEIGLKKTFEYGGSVDNTPAMYKDGSGIHINPANKGKFTASASRAGMGVQEFARHVLANKEDYSSTQVKRANFARNAAKWKHEDGGPVDYTPSYAFGNVQSKNTTYNHGFGYGGMIPMYDFGSTVKDIGAGAYGIGEGLLDTVTMGATDQLTDAGYKGLQKLGNSTEAEIRQQDSIKGYGQAAGSIAGAALTGGAATGTAIAEGSEGLGQGISKGSPDSKLAKDIGIYLPMAGRFAGMAVGAGAAGGAPSTVGGGNNIGTASGSMPMFAAMGGQVNYPLGLTYDRGNMPIFAEGGMTGNLTQINVEKGELLINPKTNKILTEYKGGGMVPHPEEGMDERGTVNAEEGRFVVTKAKAEEFKKAVKENDINRANAIKQSIAFDKARKEAKEEAAANAAYNKFAKKYGGAIQRMYAKGGIIPMYDEGSNVVGPRADSGFFNFDRSVAPYPDQTYGTSSSFNVLGDNLSRTINPVSTITYPAGYGPNMSYNPAGRQGVDPSGYPVSINPAASADYKVPGMDSGNMFNSPNFNFSTLENALPYVPVAWNAIQAMRRRTKVPSFAMDTNLVAPQMSDRQGKREIIEQANLGKYNARQIGGSGTLPAMVGLANNRMRAIADYRENLDTRNAMLNYDAMTKRKAFEQFNADANMKKFMLQAKADEVPTQYASAAAEGLGKIGDTRRYERMSKDYLDRVYPYLNRQQG